MLDGGFSSIGLCAVAVPAPPDALAAEAWLLAPPMPHERKGVLREEAARLIDGLLARVARGRGALDVAIGEGLDALSIGDRLLQLGCSGVGDYAREHLGIHERTGQQMARLARELRVRPLLREAVRSGEVTARKATAILPVARGADEAAWVARARSETVRALDAAVKAAGRPEPEREGAVERVDLEVGPEARARLEEALALAGQVLGAGAPRWQRLEAICQEFLAAHPVDVRDEEDAVEVDASAAEWLEAARAALEDETACWAALDAVDPVIAPDLGDAVERGDSDGLDAELRALATMRERWDELVGHLAMLLRMLGLWRELGFLSSGHYSEERLGMAARTVEQRASLARRLQTLPGLRDALRSGRVSYEKARLVARVADEDTVGEWIANAERTTCIALRREIEENQETQMCSAGELTVRVPPRVARVLDAAFRAARSAAGHWLTPEECVLLLAEHFVATWEDVLRTRSTLHRMVLARDRGWCQVPGCSRAAAHVHHVWYRSRGGGDDGENLVSVCAAHHLHAIHGGFIRVRGRAPVGLVWEVVLTRSASSGGAWAASGAIECRV
ncbi:hypothetical protein AMOR_27650 [Anaeromyxobacter oryzae]|uniref:HNH nuclease domain-containing protein n=2 Tax=Anaeromyxobacter oryzae TaxID=2918170 RepID=A0ABM7WW83_9BACT|nr:hypothetical protein AMOR_27650 [Anaeromyxobacter oryzae]